MSVVRVIRHAPAIISMEKSFRRNPAIGSPTLNAMGLHRRRVAAAAAMATRRRRALAGHINAVERATFDRAGIVVRENALPDDLFQQLRDELASRPLPAWELRQGNAIDRTFPLPPKTDGTAFGELATFLRRADVRALIAYAAGRAGHTISMLQTVAVSPDDGEADPQANFHADTFHSNSKFWLFLHDVGEDDGPFSYAPGSHILTPERLAWEHAQAQVAAGEADKHHAAGSFRLPEAELPMLGYGKVESFPVKANTLVVADTYGFHRRTPSRRPTVRTSLYGVLRRNPFVPWNGLDGYDLPYLRTRTMATHLAMQDRRAKAGKSIVYHNEGVILAEAPPQA
ncbi:MAG: phytanoyl-CoA dioxygenase family protein [Pseudomonadota bacterium]